MEAYCVKCKKKVEITNGAAQTTKNGRQIMKGTCNKCGTGVCKFI